MDHHYAIWASDSNILLAQKKNFGPAPGWPSFQALHQCPLDTFFHYLQVAFFW
jgi:hypothetical protein